MLDENFNIIRQELVERGYKIISVARSLKGKHHLILTYDELQTEKFGLLKSYTIHDYTGTSSRGQFDEGKNLKEAKQKFKFHIDEWNRYNTSLGKLKEVK